MFAKSEWQVLLDSEIARLTRTLSDHEVASPEYQKALDGLSMLHRIKEEDKSRFGSKDTLAVVGGNLLGILMILRFERANIVVSKAMSLLLRPIIRS